MVWGLYSPITPKTIPSKKTERTQLNINIDKVLLKKLKIPATERDFTLNEFVTELLIRELSNSIN